MSETSFEAGSAPHPQQGSDEQLMLAYSAGSVEAFDQLFARYRQPMYGFFRRRVADPAQAEELSQEVFLVLIRAAATYRETATFRTFLYAIGLRLLKAYRRKVAFRATFLGLVKSEPEADSSCETDLAIRAAVGKLNPVEREMVLLREFEQLTYIEIAELLQMPLNSVRTRLYRARASLRELLEVRPSQAGMKSMREERL